MRCRKCWSENLVDASAELVGASAEPGEWMKCFQCGWRGRPLTGRVTVAKDTETQRRHCHAPGILAEFCTRYPLVGQDYCRKHLDERSPHPAPVKDRAPLVDENRAVFVDAAGNTSRPMPPEDEELDCRPSSSLTVVSAPTIGDAVERAIARMSADLAVLERAREILSREA